MCQDNDLNVHNFCLTLFFFFLCGCACLVFNSVLLAITPNQTTMSLYSGEQQKKNNLIFNALWHQFKATGVLR